MGLAVLSFYSQLALGTIPSQEPTQCYLIKTTTLLSLGNTRGSRGSVSGSGVKDQTDKRCSWRPVAEKVPGDSELSARSQGRDQCVCVFVYISYHLTLAPVKV